MSITDELRSAAVKSECASGRCEKLYRGDLERIAERIDAALEEGYIELPKDADGQTIRIGDTLEGYSKTIKVVELRNAGAWHLVDEYGIEWDCHEAFAHIQPDSWERIIEDATALGAQMGRRTMQVDDLVERCKRLAGEGA